MRGSATVVASFRNPGRIPDSEHPLATGTNSGAETAARFAMLRVIAGLSLALLACGTPCTRVAASESAADDRGAGCNASRNAWSSSKSSVCERNLPDCSENDLKQFELYAKCLDALPRCSEGQKTSWELSRAACSFENIAFKVNLSCLKDL